MYYDAMGNYNQGQEGMDMSLGGGVGVDAQGQSMQSTPPHSAGGNTNRLPPDSTLLTPLHSHGEAAVYASSAQGGQQQGGLPSLASLGHGGHGHQYRGGAQ